MGKWLVVAAVVLATGSTAATAQMKGLAALDVANVVRTRTLDLRVTDPAAPEKHVPMVSSMILRRDVATNASLGIGLGNFYSRKKGSFRPDDPPTRSRKPAVTFSLKF